MKSMFNPQDFQEYPELQSHIGKINKYSRKEKESKLEAKVEDLLDLLNNKELRAPITYIVSILIEEYPHIINRTQLNKIEQFIQSEETKLKLNTIIILGFFLIHHPKVDSSDYISQFAELLSSPNEDIRYNSYYFLSRLIEENPKLLCEHKKHLLNALKLEVKDERIENIILLIQFLRACKKLNFKERYRIREMSIEMIDSRLTYENNQLKKALLEFLGNIFPQINGKELSKTSPEDLKQKLENIFIMSKVDFTKKKKEQKIEFNTFLERFKESALEEVELYFYTKDKEKNQVNFYELEKEKTLAFFAQDSKLSREEIIEQFSRILDPEDLELFVITLVKLGQIKGYLSEFYFYPVNYIKSRLISDLDENGYISLKKYNHLPLELVKNCIKDIGKEKGMTILIGKEKKIFYSLSRIKSKLSKIASREASIDLEEYRNKLTSPSFLRLVNHLPQDYLTDYHKNSTWLTNSGKIKFEQELRNSKVIGYFDIETVSQKIEVSQPLLLEVLQAYIDERAGIWNKIRDKFYYSKYIKSELEKIDQVADPEEKEREIEQLSHDLNIQENKLKNELDKKVDLIAQEIQEKDKIRISNYLEKTGMNKEAFFEFIDSLDLTYLKKGDLLIFNPSKIENAKKKVKQFIKKEAKSKDFISLGTYDISSALIRDLINDLRSSGKINGIFHAEEEGQIRFYTEQGIKNMMLEKTYMFSFHDLFYGKDLSEEEIATIKDIFMDLYNSGKLKGNFDEESLTFTTDEILFASEYNKTFHEFHTTINNYFAIFNSKFQYIKKVLNKETTILPKEIKRVEKLIKTINKKAITWKNDLDAFITRKHKELLNQQGISLGQYRKLSPEEKERREIKALADDEEVEELMEGFEIWDNLYDKLEKKYLNVLFYQKQHIKNPDNQKYLNLLRNLKIELNLI